MNGINRNTIYIAAGTFVIGFFLCWMIFGRASKTIPESPKHIHSESTIWTCSMHPQIRKSQPGQCPICGMDLIPLNTKSSDDNPMEIKMSPTAMQLANVQTSIVSKQKPVKEVRINGKVKANEEKVYSQSSHIPGRIEKLMVNFTGESVRKGQVLAYVYSPELITAQEELLEAYKIKESQPALYQAAKEKLRNWKLTERQVHNVIEQGNMQEQFPILSDVSGIVLNKKVNLGDYIKRGQSIYEIANLNTVWVLFDIYESDIPWINTGDEVAFSIQSLPGETFRGKVSFIDPVINPQTRVASARVEILNSGMRLKPDMFAHGTVKSPLHEESEALIVPKSAVMWTGERSVVYVKHTSATGVSFLMKEVQLGPALGDSYVIKEGLETGEEIATNGTFSIDAAAQLAGKPSMMNPEGGVTMTGHNHGSGNMSQMNNDRTYSNNITISRKAKGELKPILTSYMKLKKALVADDFETARSGVKEMALELSKVHMGVFTGEAHTAWMKYSVGIGQELKKADNVNEIGKLRVFFKNISDQMVMLVNTFGVIDRPIYIEHCPMANNNNGADWLSGEKEIKNPYFGKKMIGCGEVIKKIE